MDSPNVMVRTTRSPAGKPVPIEMLDDALRELRQAGIEPV
jgi:hypothetical protein